MGAWTYKSNKSEKQAQAEEGSPPWTPAWADDITETDLLEGIFAAGLSISSGNAGPFFKWVRDLVTRTAGSLAISAAQTFPVSLLDNACQVAFDAIKAAIQEQSQNHVTKSYGTVDFKAGAIRYSGRNYVYGNPFGPPTFGLIPYVMFRLNEPAIPPAGVVNLLYAVRSSTGKLHLLQHLNATELGSTFAGDAMQIGGGGWGAYRLFSGGQGTIYGVKSNKLYFIRHKLKRDGSSNFTPSSFTQIGGSGWGTFSHLFSGGGGYIYGIKNDHLYVIRHLGYLDGGNSFTPDNMQQIGGGGYDDFTHAFSGGQGIIYAVKANGRLHWLRHFPTNEGGQIPSIFTGNAAFIGGAGSGAYGKTLCSAGNGVLYGIKNGKLFATRHLGYQDGTNAFSGNMHQIGGGGYGAFSRFFAAEL